jgi:hypothetical protein
MPAPRNAVMAPIDPGDLGDRILAVLSGDPSSAYSDKDLFLLLAPQRHVEAMEQHIGPYQETLRKLVARGDIVANFTRGRNYYAINRSIGHAR